MTNVERVVDGVQEDGYVSVVLIFYVSLVKV